MCELSEAYMFILVIHVLSFWQIWIPDLTVQLFAKFFQVTTSGSRVDINIRIMLILLEFKMICERKQDSVLSLFEILELTVALNVNSLH